MAREINLPFRFVFSFLFQNPKNCWNQLTKTQLRNVLLSANQLTPFKFESPIFILDTHIVIISLIFIIMIPHKIVDSFFDAGFGNDLLDLIIILSYAMCPVHYHWPFNQFIELNKLL